MQIKDMMPWSHRAPTARREPAAGREEDHPVAALERDMTRAFGDFWSRFADPFADPGGAEGGALARADIVEVAGGVEVSVELPGMERENIEVALTRDALTVRGEKTAESAREAQGTYLSERAYGSVQRTIPLPSGVDTDRAEARFRNGVLTVTLPQSAEAASASRRIDVRTG